MTSEEFEAGYAQRSGMSVQQLHLWGRYPEPCDCGEAGCEGWAMGHQQEEAYFENERRRMASERAG